MTITEFERRVLEQKPTDDGLGMGVASRSARAARNSFALAR